MIEKEEELLHCATLNDWTISISRARKTNSSYFTFQRDGERIKVRISDHKTYFKTEHYSLSPDGYNDSISVVFNRLKAEKFTP